jgi:hypothetical protein
VIVFSDIQCEHSFYEVNYQFIFLDGEENDENLNDLSK